VIEFRLEYDTAGDPITGLKWSRRTTAKVATALGDFGIHVSANTVARLLQTMGYSLRVNHKQLATDASPDRNEQFLYSRPNSPMPLASPSPWPTIPRARPSGTPSSIPSSRRSPKTGRVSHSTAIRRSSASFDPLEPSRVCRSPRTWIAATIRPAWSPRRNSFRPFASNPVISSRTGTTQSHPICELVFARALRQKFGLEPSDVGHQIAFGGNDYGLDAYYIDPKARNMYLFQFKWTEDHNQFKSSLERLSNNGLARIFGATGQDQYQNDLLQYLKKDLTEHRHVIEAVHLQFVFKGDVEAAAKSESLQFRREDLENKVHLRRVRHRRRFPHQVGHAGSLSGQVPHRSSAPGTARRGDFLGDHGAHDRSRPHLQC
jgi:hypothetical protein